MLPANQTMPATPFLPKSFVEPYISMPAFSYFSPNMTEDFFPVFSISQADTESSHSWRDICSRNSPGHSSFRNTMGHEYLQIVHAMGF